MPFTVCNLSPHSRRLKGNAEVMQFSVMCSLFGEVGYFSHYVEYRNPKLLKELFNTNILAALLVRDEH